jgi:hypothetical protein
MAAPPCPWKSLATLHGSGSGPVGECADISRLIVRAIPPSVTPVGAFLLSIPHMLIGSSLRTSAYLR